MKQTLLPAGMDSVAELPLPAAVALAQRHGAQISAMLYPRVIDAVIADPMSWSLTSLGGPEGDLETQKQTARTAFQTRIAELGEAGNAVELDLETLSSWRGLGEISRVFDLTVLARGASQPDWQLVFESVLFQGGRPVVLVPDGWQAGFGDTVAIAWNRSTETARLVGQGLWALRQAKQVHVIELPGWGVPGPDGAALMRYLRQNEVPADLHVGENGGGDYGYRILRECKRLDVDLLLKGAYTQSRLTQMIFGGATKQILEEAEIPVLFAH